MRIILFIDFLLEFQYYSISVQFKSAIMINWLIYMPYCNVVSSNGLTLLFIFVFFFLQTLLQTIPILDIPIWCLSVIISR